MANRKLRVGVNGFGRIGRTLLRGLASIPRSGVQVVAINAPGDKFTQKHLLEYDSVHGRYPSPISLDKDTLHFQGHRATLLNQREISKLPWGDLGVDLVLECTGKFRDKNSNLEHLELGASKVLVSAPCKEADSTIVYGVNHQDIEKGHKVVSSASCTTNCLAPLMKLMDDSLGVEKAFINTVHAYTSDQALLDKHHKDPRRGRAANLSIVPTTTGATATVELILPHLKGKIHGSAVRVPTPNVSLLDLYICIRKSVDVEGIHKVFQDAARGAMKDILTLNELPLVSIDFNGHDASCIVDLTQTKVIGEDFVRICAWYDNEWGFCQRMWDTCTYMRDNGFFERQEHDIN